MGKAQSNESPSGGAVGGSLNRGGQTVTDTLPAPTASGSGSPSSSGSGAAATSTSSGIAAAGRHAEVGGTLGAIVGLVALLGI